MTIPIILEKCVLNLREVRLFQGLDDKKLMEIAALCKLVEVREGDYLVREEDPAQEFYILLSGEISISKKLRLPNLETVQAGERVLSRMNADEKPPIGETAIVGQSHRMASVQCIKDCVFYRIETNDMLELMAEESDIAAHTYRELSGMLYERLETANTDVIKLTAALMFALED